MSGTITSCDLFSNIGGHAIGLGLAGIETVQLVENNPSRKAFLERRFPGIPIHDDARTFSGRGVKADIIVGGPPCQATSVAAAIHGKRTGETLWPEMLRVGLNMGAEWFVVEQPTGNKIWEDQVSGDLAEAGLHAARAEFSARDLGAPHARRRVYIIAHRDLQRLARAWRSIPSQIERVARTSTSRGDWSSDLARVLRVDARAPHRVDRKPRIEAIGDSNPPQMMEAIGLALIEAIHGQ